LFLDGAIAEWSGHTSTLVALCMWLNDGMLRAANYTSSFAHTWCCALAPLSCFYRAFSKLPLSFYSPMYIFVTRLHTFGPAFLETPLSVLFRPTSKTVKYRPKENA
jgi:hypothetical protein